MTGKDKEHLCMDTLFAKFWILYSFTVSDVLTIKQTQGTRAKEAPQSWYRKKDKLWTYDSQKIGLTADILTIEADITL